MCVGHNRLLRSHIGGGLREQPTFPVPMFRCAPHGFQHDRVPAALCGRGEVAECGALRQRYAWSVAGVCGTRGWWKRRAKAAPSGVECGSGVMGAVFGRK